MFEILILARFSTAGCLREYEPALPGGGRGEARVEVDGQTALIEARSKMDDDRGGGGAFNPFRMGRKLFRKLRDKYSRQYRNIAEPLIIFFSLEAGVIQDIEPEAAIKHVLADAQSKAVSAIMFSETYRAERVWIWENPNAARPLTQSAMNALTTLFKLTTFRPTGLT